ncbi:MAG: hypothetical protein LBK42_11315 [Propionibacteriaceae bacterium]|jgi:putative FmdB family regulatory protein|nr:hypothetical protein [Propionibacteriaceae bacterium]
MPTYQYHCTQCDHDLEVFQKMTDSSLTTCPSCTGRLRKVFSPVGVVFKGSGFYATDNRSKKTSPATPSSHADADSSASSADTAASPKAETTSPAKAETTTSAKTTPASPSSALAA